MEKITKDDSTIKQLAEKIRAVQLEKPTDYSAKKKAIVPLMHKLSWKLQTINSILHKTKSYTFTEDDAVELFQLVYESASKKGQIFRYFENFIWGELTPLPFQLNFTKDDETFNTLERNCDLEKLDNENDRVNQIFINFCFDILDLKQKRQNTAPRRDNALRILAEMQDYYYIPDSYDVFISYLANMDSEEQYISLEGLEQYFLLHAEEIPGDLLIELDNIFDKTNVRESASTCLEIKMNVGLIDQFYAVCAMDDWKAERYDEPQWDDEY